jgi:hypothetical protein
MSQNSDKLARLKIGPLLAVFDEFSLSFNLPFVFDSLDVGRVFLPISVRHIHFPRGILHCAEALTHITRTLPDIVLLWLNSLTGVVAALANALHFHLLLGPLIPSTNTLEYT